MSVGCNQKTADSDVISGYVGTISTASIAFTVDRFYLLSFRCVTGATAWGSVSWTIGTTGTWTEVVPTGGRIADPDDSKRGSIMYRFACASSVTGAVSMTLAGDTASTWVWAVDEFTGCDQGGTNGSNAIVQAKSGTRALGDASPLVCSTLSAFGSVNNATYGAAHYGGANIAAGSGFTTKANLHTTSDGVLTEFRPDNDTTVDWTYTGTGTRATGLGVELKAATVGAGTASNVLDHPARRLRRFNW